MFWFKFLTQLENKILDWIKFACHMIKHKVFLGSIIVTLGSSLFGVGTVQFSRVKHFIQTFLDITPVEHCLNVSIAAAIAFFPSLYSDKPNGGSVLLFVCIMMIIQLISVWKVLLQTKRRFLEQIDAS